MMMFAAVLIVVGLMATQIASAADRLPLPRDLELAGLHAYAEKTVTAGETIHFRVSSTVPYELSICRLGHAIDDPAGDDVLFTFPQSPPVRQPIHPGSFVHVANGLPSDRALAALTLECWVRPWRLNSWQTLMGQHNYPTACGYGLFLDAEGRTQFYLSDGGAIGRSGRFRVPSCRIVNGSTWSARGMEPPSRCGSTANLSGSRHLRDRSKLGMHRCGWVRAVTMGRR